MTLPSDAGTGADAGMPTAPGPAAPGPEVPGATAAASPEPRGPEPPTPGLPAEPDVPGLNASALATPRRRTHPLTPLVASVRSLGVLVGVFVVFGTGNLRDLAANLGGLLGLVLILGAFAVLMLVSLGLNYLAWTRTEYFFDESGDFRLDSGVLQRNERRVTLSRLQSVDTTRPLLGRVVGLSQVRIEVAGGGDSRVLLSYLTDAQAQALRAEIIARAAGMSPDVGEAPEAVLATVPTGDLVVSLLLRSETMLLLAVTVLLVVAVTATEGPGGLVLILVTGGLPLISVFSQFTRFFGFTVADSPDGLRLRHGLVNVQSQTVPPGRVQAIEISEPLLWRRKGWVRVSLNVAGLQSDENGQGEHVLLPVAPHDVARQIITRVMPGVDPAAMDFLPAPDRARRRAWLQFRNLGVAHDQQVLAASRGFLTRRVAVIPHARTQSVGVTQGPWQRRLGLASVQVDSTPGPVSIVVLHRLAGEARHIAEEQLLRAAASRGTGPGERWMTGLRVPPAPPAQAQQPAPASAVDPGAVAAPVPAPGATPAPAPGATPAPTPGPAPASAVDPGAGATPELGPRPAPEFGQGSP